MRLGHLASDLARIASFTEMELDEGAIKRVMEEAEFFAEWTVREVEIEIQRLLAEIQGFLAQARLQWDTLSKNTEWKTEVAKQCRAWANTLLERGGFTAENAPGLPGGASGAVPARGGAAVPRTGGRAKRGPLP